MRRKIFTQVDGGRAEGLACADPGTTTPIGVAGNVCLLRSRKNLMEIDYGHEPILELHAHFDNCR